MGVVGRGGRCALGGRARRRRRRLDVEDAGPRNRSGPFARLRPARLGNLNVCVRAASIAASHSRLVLPHVM